MKEPGAVVPTASERVNDLPRILDAMKEAVREALVRHQRAGHPIAVWRDGQVVWIQPEDIPSALGQDRP
jgi:hypothetical protein